MICNGEETNKLTNNIETPPTTPDSFTTSLTTSTNNKVNTVSQILSNETKVITDSNVKREAGAKYSPNPLVVSLFINSYLLIILSICYNVQVMCFFFRMVI